MVSERGKLEQLMADPAAFRDVLLIDTDDGPRKFGPNLDDWQREDFSFIDGALRRAIGQDVEAVQQVYCERHRGASKTSDIAASVAWALFASRRKINGICCAADRDQAGLIRDAIDTLLRLNPWLGKILEVQRDKVVNLKSGSTLTILSSDAATSFGLLCDFIVVDELSVWKSRDLWDSVLSTSAKRRHCALLIISNAGWQQSWQYELREAIRTDPSWIFRRLEGFASWITQEKIDQQRRLLPFKVWERLWGNTWTDGSGDALSGSDIDAAISLPGPWSGPRRGWTIVAGLDIGLARDSSALCILAKHVGHIDRTVRQPKPLPGVYSALVDAEFFDAPKPQIEYNRVAGTGQLELVAMRVWSPKNGERVQLDDIEREILALHRSFGIVRLSFDPWQAEHLVQRLTRQGVYCNPVHFVPSNLQSMATVTLDAFRERQLSIFNHAELVDDLRAMKVVEKSSGFRLEMAKGGTEHGDAAQALALALESSRAIRDSSLIASRQLVLN